MLLVYVDRRLLRTKFLPLFCSGVDWKAGITSGRLMKFSRYVSHKEKYRPRSAAMDFVGVNRRQNESGVLQGGKFFRGLFLTEVVVLTVITNHFCRRFAINLQVQWDL